MRSDSLARCDGLILQVEKVAMTAAMEIIASHVTPDECLPELTQLAKDITVTLALHLADLVTSFLTGVLDGQAVLLFGTGTSALLQASYWARPIYEELLYASSHSYLFFFARSCLGKVPGRAPFSQRSERATACSKLTYKTN